MPVVTFCNRGIWEDFNATHFTSEDNLRYILLSSVELWYLPYIKWILWWLLLVNGITNPWCTFWIGQHQYWSITMFSYLLPYNHNNAKKIILVGFLVLSFGKFWSVFLFMHQGHMSFIAISKSAHFDLSKTIFTFPQIFSRLGIARQGMEKLGLDPFVGPIRAQTLAKNLNESKSYLL